MPVRTEQLAFFVAPAQGSVFPPQTVYTCPAGRRTIIKELIVSWGSAVDDSIALIAIRKAGQDVHIFREETDPTESRIARRVERWTVMETGDELRVHVAYTPTNIGNELRVIASGTELVL